MVNIPLFKGFHTSQVVQDFFHQQYTLLKLPVTVSLPLKIGPFDCPQKEMNHRLQPLEFAGANLLLVSGRVATTRNERISHPPKINGTNQNLRFFPHCSLQKSNHPIFQTLPFTVSGTGNTSSGSPMVRRSTVCRSTRDPLVVADGGTPEERCPSLPESCEGEEGA